MEIKNVSKFEIMNGDWPNVYTCRFLEDGIVMYKEMGKDGTMAYLTNETIEKMASSFIGKPVCIDHQKITKDNYEELRKNGTIVGNVIGVRKNAKDGWWWADFIVDTEAGRKRIDKEKDKVSCAYMVNDTTKGGLWHDIPYNVEIIDGFFTHLALVENPRYEGANIEEQLPAMLVNDKTAHLITYEEGKDMKNVLEFFQSLGNKKEKVDLTVAINGKEMPLSEVLETLMTETIKNTKTTAPEKIKVGDKEYTVEEVVNGFKKSLEAKNVKNCNCDGKDGHKSDCPMYENSKADKLKNALAKNESDRTDEEKELVKESEKEMKESKNAKQLAEEKAKEIQNAKDKELMEFFNQLHKMANKPGEEVVNTQAPAPTSRAERAAKFSAKVKENLGKK
jgi:Uncharacterized protein conserved in bacteria (DUF2213)